MTPLGYQQLVPSGVSQGLTVPNVGGIVPTYAIMIVDAGAIRWRDDGVAAAANSMYLSTNLPMKYAGDLNAFRFVNQGATFLNVSYYV